MILTARDTEILRSLIWKVRLFTLAQLSTTWWTDSPSGRSEARRRCRRLVDQGLLEMTAVHARPLPSLTAPVCCWAPGEPTPDFGRVSYVLRCRWAEAPRTVTAYVATTRAANAFGGHGGPLRHPLQATHDIGVSQVYLTYRATTPWLARAWVGEDVVPRSQRRRVRVPDALIRDDSGRTSLAVEFGGAYDAARVAGFHEDCLKTGVPYVLW